MPSACENLLKLLFSLDRYLSTGSTPFEKQKQTLTVSFPLWERLYSSWSPKGFSEALRGRHLLCVLDCFFFFKTYFTFYFLPAERLWEAAGWSWTSYLPFLGFGAPFVKWGGWNEWTWCLPLAPGLRKLYSLIQCSSSSKIMGGAALPSVWGACVLPFPSPPSSSQGKISLPVFPLSSLPTSPRGISSLGAWPS